MKEFSYKDTQKLLLSAQELQETKRLKEKFPLFYSQLLKEIELALFNAIPKVNKPKPKCYKCTMPLIGRSCKLCIFSNWSLNNKSIRYSRDPICGTCHKRGHNSECCLLNDSDTRDFSQITCLNCKSKGHANCLSG